eukprot:m.27991 g.27991  ORF g.27991 m.27991 type:complete len:521 (-) comp11760_c0_seq1:22-1584(-)
MPILRNLALLLATAWVLNCVDQGGAAPNPWAEQTDIASDFDPSAVDSAAEAFEGEGNAGSWSDGQTGPESAGGLESADQGLGDAANLGAGAEQSDAAAQATVPSSFKVLTYNTYLFAIAGAPSRMDRASWIASSSMMQGYDVVVLNELFDHFASSTLLKGLKSAYPYQTPVVGVSTTGWSNSNNFKSKFFTIRGGVAVLSKWPMQRMEQYIFTASAGWDSMAEKGFAYVVLTVNGVKVHVIGTHMQADVAHAPVRAKQLAEISTFINAKNIPASELVLVAGDLNVVKGTAEYTDMLGILNVIEPTYAGGRATYDPSSNCLAEQGTPYEWLDYVFVHQPHSAGLPQLFNTVFSPPGTFSDHYPVAASFGPVSSLWYPPNAAQLVCGRPANSDCTSNKECSNKACGRWGAGGRLLCCPSGTIRNYWGYDYCTSLPDGMPCFTSTHCASALCFRGICQKLLQSGDPCPSQSNSQCPGSLTCNRNTRSGDYRCTATTCYCSLWDKGCTTAYYYAADSWSNRLGC